MAKKKNGKYNMVNGKTGEEVSPVDFDYVTNIGWDTGKFTFGYAGDDFVGTPYGFYMNPDEEEMDIISPYEELTEF